MLVVPLLYQYIGGAPLEHLGDRTAVIHGSHCGIAVVDKDFDTIRSPQVLVS